jgi:CheY-like chemotaxis protein
VRIDIQDTGTGIPEKSLPRIFDPYFTTKQKGSGLGLATSYSIIRNHGGVIEVKSELNKGSTFTIHLPAVKGVEREGETTMSSAAATVTAKKGRLLLMDDEKVVRKVAAEMIATLGHEVDTAPDGAKAIALFRQAKESGKPYDLLILDLTVKGGMGGEETIQRILELDPEVKAVVSSGYADSPVVAHYRDYGFSAFLNKPYKLADLKECLNQSLP